MSEITWSIIRSIGDNGGFGEVFEVTKKIDGIAQTDKYALKKLSSTDEESIKRFQKEISLLKDLNHSKIVKVEGFRLDAEPYFYTMPLFQSSLRKVLSGLKGDHIRIKMIFNQIFDGVQYLHNSGVCHRDLKPENILFNSDDDIVISDFGFGLNLNSKSSRITKTGEIFGTMYYTSPEQLVDGKSVDHRTDIYSLGIMMYECYTGKLSIRLNIDLLPDIFKDIITKCTMNNPDDRYQCITELISDFNNAIDSLIP